MPFLKLLSGPHEVPLLEIEKDVTRIGKKADVCGNFTLHDDRVSGLHCTIERAGSGFVLIDRGSGGQGSKNGTRVNGNRLEPLQPYPLMSGDEILIAKIFLFRFSDDDSESMSGPAHGVVVGQRAEGSRLSVKVPGSVHGVNEPTVATLESRFRLLTKLIESLRQVTELRARSEQVLGTLLELLPNVDRGLLWIPRHRGLREGLFVTRLRRGWGTAPETPSVPPDVYQAVMIEGCAARTEDERVLAAPLFDRQNRILGCILLESLGDRHRTGPADLDMLRTAAHLVSFAVDVALLQQVEQEMKEGRRIVEALLPAHAPQLPEYEFFHFYKPASFVGGDYYDFIPLNDRTWVICIADVSGKQLAASLFMTRLAGELRSLLEPDRSLTDVVERLNRRLCTQAEKTVTLLLLRLDLDTHQIRLVNAGHCTPLLRRPCGAVEEVGYGCHGCVLGAVDDWKFEEYSTTLQPGETLVLYTDGCTDAENARQERYDVSEQPRLRSAVAGTFASVAELGQHICQDIADFVGEVDQFDDICLVALRRRT
ncbi:MAG: SpoIIE family protein phosphatase [Pirellulales bacterium]